MNEPNFKILEIHAREILDSRGYPTVEVELTLENDATPGALHLGRAAAPSGASTGEGEALELRDGDPKRYLGKGVLKAVSHVRTKIAPAIRGRSFSRQSLLDDALCELDGTPNKANLGANAVLGVSMAYARAVSRALGVPTYQRVSEMFDCTGVTLPVPLMNIINGGKHGENGLDLQEFMIVPAGFTKFSDALRAGVETFHHLKKILKSKGLTVGVGDEGGFAPQFSGEEPHAQCLSAILQAITDAGYQPGKQIFLALDCASSEFASKPGSGDRGSVIYTFEGVPRTAQDMIEIYRKWMDAYPILSIEDGLSEHDWMGWALLTQELGSRCQLVGDDLFVTNIAYLKKGIERKAGNSILIKLNQIGTLTETLETMKLALSSGYSTIVSHRSGETEDTFIADLAVGTDAGQIKTGSGSRTDRIAKYNQLLRIEEELGARARFAGKAAFRGLLK
jgi:enolase